MTIFARFSFGNCFGCPKNGTRNSSVSDTVSGHSPNWIAKQKQENTEFRLFLRCKPAHKWHRKSQSIFRKYAPNVIIWEWFPVGENTGNSFWGSPKHEGKFEELSSWGTQELAQEPAGNSFWATPTLDRKYSGTSFWGTPKLIRKFWEFRFGVGHPKNATGNWRFCVSPPFFCNPGS